MVDVRALLLGDSGSVETSKQEEGKFADAVVPQMCKEVVVVQFKLQYLHFPEVIHEMSCLPAKSYKPNVTPEITCPLSLFRPGGNRLPLV